MKKLLSKLDWSYFYAFIGEATLALTFAFYIILARVLGPEDYGVFAAAVALAAVLSLFIQFGLTNLLLREVAANPETGPRLTIQCLLVELISAGGVLLFLFPLASILGYQDRELLVCYLAVLSEVGRAAIMTLRNVAKGEGWFRAESIAVAIERAAVMLVACLVLYQTENLVLVMLTVVAVRFLDALGLFYFLNRKLDLWSPISGQGLWKLTQAAYPFAMSGVLWIIYYQVDVVMLNALSTEAETGFYSASYRVLEIFSSLPRVIFYVLFTRFARYNVTNPEKLPEQLYKAARLLLAVVMPAVLVAGFAQEILVQSLYGDAFTRSILSLAVLLPSLSVKMFGNLVYQFAQAVGQEKRLPKLLFAAALSNVIVNAILIPQFASLGAAIATLASEFVLTILGLKNLTDMGYGQVSHQLGWLTVLSLVATVIPSLILVWGLNLFVGIAIIVISCIGILLMMQPKKFFAQS